MKRPCKSLTGRFPVILRTVCSILFHALLLLLCACAGDDDNSSPPLADRPAPDLSDVAAYYPDSPYAWALTTCATATRVTSLCSLGTLPLIGQAASTPTVADVMDRVLVSHDWMGRNFEEVLKQLPPDILSLFKGVTAIVIDSDIRPSFYSYRTAAIYLDPASLWLTIEEQATVSQSPDYRNDFGAELPFVNLSRYVKNGDYAYAYHPLEGTDTRQASDILYPVARLLYHELAHANDFLPPALQPALDLQSTPYAAVQALEASQTARLLTEAAPLASQTWIALGQVLYLGVPATAEQKDFSADFVGRQFEDDGANDPYGYSTAHEDVAMLFEEAMLKYHFGIDRDVAFADTPMNVDPVCDDYLVQWGVRNRLGDPDVKVRAALVAGELLADRDLDDFFAGLPLPAPMAIKLGWCSNLNLGAAVPLALEPARRIHPDQVTLDKRHPD